MSKYKYGWKPGFKDIVTPHFLSVAQPLKELPPSSGLKPFAPPIFDQGDLGSCTANGWLFAYGLVATKMGLNKPIMSRLDLYYYERDQEGDVDEDSGATITEGLDVLTGLGVCYESDWPYDVTKFDQYPPNPPPPDAVNNKVTLATQVQSSSLAVVQALAQGYPVVFGISVYESFESDEVLQSGIVPFPTVDEQFMGGHCMCAVDYDLDAKQIYCANSWGTSVGLNGYFKLPFEYFDALASDMKALHTVK